MCSLLILSWAEIVKLLKLRLTWVLLVLLVVILGMRLNNIHGHAFDEPPELTDFDVASLVVLPEDYRQAAILPGVFKRARLSFDWLNIFMILLVVLTVGQEFTWGTMRTTLARGTGRTRLLMAKFIALAVVAAFYLLILWIACGLFGLLTTQSLEGRIDWSFLDGAFLVQEIAVLARTWAIICPVIALALLVAVWTRNPGLSLTLVELTYGFDLLTSIFSGGLLGIFLMYVIEASRDPREIGAGLWGALMTVFPHYNSTVVIHWGLPGKLSELELAMLSSAEALNLPRDPWRCLVLLLGYGLVALVLALWIFRRKDITV